MGDTRTNTDPKVAFWPALAVHFFILAAVFGPWVLLVWGLLVLTAND